MPFASSQGDAMVTHVSQKPTGTLNEDLASITGTEDIKPSSTGKATTTFEEAEAIEVPEVYTLANGLLVLLIIAVAGVAFWWLGGSRLVSRLLGPKGGRYSIVGNDEEK